MISKLIISQFLGCSTVQWPELLLVHVLFFWTFPAMAGISQKDKMEILLFSYLDYLALSI